MNKNHVYYRVLYSGSVTLTMTKPNLMYQSPSNSTRFVFKIWNVLPIMLSTWIFETETEFDAKIAEICYS